MEGVRCVSNTNTLWSVRNEATLRDVMRRVREKQPFGWLRFADGDMNQLEKKPCGFQRRQRRRRYTRAMENWATLPNLVVSVGEWWLCKRKYADIWKNRVEAIPAVNKKVAFHAGCFYLPMGTPDDDDLEYWASRGIGGGRAPRDANVTVAFVGPRNLANIPWLTNRGWNEEDAAIKRARFVDATGVSDHATRMDAAMAKIEALSRREGAAFRKRATPLATRKTRSRCCLCFPRGTPRRP